MSASSIKYLLERRGRDVVITRESSGGTYNVATGTVTGGSPASETFRGAFVNYKQDEVDGTRVTQADSKLLLAAKGATLVPQTGDLADGDAYRVINAHKIEDGSEVIGYICQVRG